MREHCAVYWGTHGCDLPRGHKGPHQCTTGDSLVFYDLHSEYDEEKGLVRHMLYDTDDDDEVGEWGEWETGVICFGPDVKPHETVPLTPPGME